MDETEHAAAWASAARPPERLVLGPLTLRRWVRTDAEALDPVITASREHLRGFMPWAAAHDRSGTQAYLERCELQWADRTAFQYALADTSDDAVLGSAGLMGRIGPGALEIGYWVRADRTRRGLATLAAAGLAEAGLALPGVDRVEIHHDVANVASAGVPRRLGFTRVGEIDVVPEAEAETGRQAVWSLTRSAWPGSPASDLLESLNRDRTRR